MAGDEMTYQKWPPNLISTLIRIFTSTLLALITMLPVPCMEGTPVLELWYNDTMCSILCMSILPRKLPPSNQSLLFNLVKKYILDPTG